MWREDMAVDTSSDLSGVPEVSAEAPQSADGWATTAASRILPLLRRIRIYAKLLLSKFPSHLIFTSLARRIFVANLLGLLVLVGGIYYVSKSQAWLITAKKESLRIQGEIIAKAIAARAKETSGGGLSLDLSKIADIDGARIPFRDDAFAAMELSISPHDVTPLLRRLIGPTNTRARIFTRDYTLIADSNDMLAPAGFADELDFGDDGAAKKDGSQSAGRPEPMRSFWTRVNSWFAPDEMPVYRDLTNDKISRYAEIRVAMKSGTSMEMLVLNEQGQQIVSLATPIMRMKTVLGVLLLSTKPGEIDRIISDERRVLWTFVLLGVLATFLASFVLTKTISRPMRDLSAAAVNVRRNINERARLPRFPRRSDEVAKLADAFHDMTAALYRRIEQSEKFAADVSHELKNPLTAARGTAEALAYVKDAEKRDELAAQIGLELRRLDRLITDVANASRLNADLALQESEEVDLREILSGVTDVFKDMHGRETNNIELHMAELSKDAKHFLATGHKGRLAQVATNLIDNAISFSPEGGLVKVSLLRIGSDIEVRVEDEGQGIPADKLEQIFSRFYSDRPGTEARQGKNSGLGLSISREIIQAYDGKIWAENRGVPLQSQSRKESAEQGNRRGDGAVFIIRLPAAYPNLRHLGSRSARW